MSNGPAPRFVVPPSPRGRRHERRDTNKGVNAFAALLHCSPDYPQFSIFAAVRAGRLGVRGRLSTVGRAMFPTRLQSVSSVVSMACPQPVGLSNLVPNKSRIMTDLYQARLSTFRVPLMSAKLPSPWGLHSSFTFAFFRLWPDLLFLSSATCFCSSLDILVPTTQASGHLLLFLAYLGIK